MKRCAFLKEWPPGSMAERMMMCNGGCLRRFASHQIRRQPSELTNPQHTRPRWLENGEEKKKTFTHRSRSTQSVHLIESQRWCVSCSSVKQSPHQRYPRKVKSVFGELFVGRKRSRTSCIKRPQTQNCGLRPGARAGAFRESIKFGLHNI